MSEKNITDLINMLAASGAGTGGNIPPRRLPKKPEAPAIPARSGVSGPVPPKTPKPTGIAGPLAETAYADRTWHPEKTVASSDGLFSLRIKPIKSMKFADANGSAVEMTFKSPP